ncbi:hypothetical protein [Actinophytocola sp.]|uniref:hypothetical protein n=1 Tax=Actinophytocola sp. TaxID=1872138 RepID=UPI003899D803
MSRPGGPDRDERYPPQQRPYPQGGYQQGYPQRGYPDQGYQPDYGQDPGPDYGPGPGADYQYDQRSNYGGGQGGAGQGYAPYDEAHDRGYGQGQAPRRPAAQDRSWEPEPERESGGGFRPGLGLVFSLLGLVVQVLSLTVLPWVTAGGDSAALPKLWDAAKDVGNGGGFSAAYVFMFSYPLAVLGILLSLVAVLQSVAMKVIWAVLAFIGVAALALKFGWDPISGGGMHFSRQEITLGIIAAAVLVVVIVMLKMAMSTFRIVGGLILLVCAGVHVYALKDLIGDAGFSLVGIGAYGTAAGYVLAALAAFIGPRKLA